VATPVVVKLTCPLCQTAFQAKTMGSSYYIAGVDTDLRETGSIEDVRRYAVATCPCCGNTDYTWNLQAPDDLDEVERAALAEALEFDPAAPRRAGSRVATDFQRLERARTCFVARGLEASSLAELALLAYYVARDLGQRDLEPRLRDEAAALFEQAIAEEDLPPALLVRDAYLAGELARRAGRRDAALAAFDRAVEAAEEAEAEGESMPSDPATDVARLARRMHANLVYRDAPADTLLELSRDDDDEVAGQARRLLARRRDRASVDAIRAAWAEAPDADKSVMLSELEVDPPAALFDLLVEALGASAPDDVRAAARALGVLGDPRAAGPLLAALERGVLSTEAVLVEALRRVEAPGRDDRLLQLLSRWEAQAENTGDPDVDQWRFTSDPTPIRNLLYTSSHPAGLQLLIRDLKALRENDLWDKVPSGGPVSAALTTGGAATLALHGLLVADNPATRRWAAYCLAERQDSAAEVGASKPELTRLVSDPDRAVRLQAASALARLGDPSHEGVVLKELRGLAEEDVPFALHFLVPFKSAAVKALLLELLEAGTATPGEVLPLLGRQAPDEKVRALLVESLLDTNDDARAGGVTGLAFLGGPEACKQLRALYDQEESDEVCRRIVFGLGQLARRGHERDATVRFLRERLGVGQARLRFAIALTLLTLDDPSGIDIVRQRAALFDESFERYDLVAPALKVLAAYDARRPAAAR